MRVFIVLDINFNLSHFDVAPDAKILYVKLQLICESIDMLVAITWLLPLHIDSPIP